MDADSLRHAASTAQHAAAHLVQLAEQTAAVLAAAEQRAAVAEAALARARERLKRAPAVQPELRAAARALLAKLDDLTTEQFALGGEREEREALKALVEEAEQQTKE